MDSLYVHITFLGTFCPRAKKELSEKWPVIEFLGIHISCAPSVPFLAAANVSVPTQGLIIKN